MTLDQALHTKCDRCGEDAGHHRLTDGGRFYCLIFKNAYQRRNSSKQVAQRCNCNELYRSQSLNRQKEVSKTILLHVRGIGTPDGQLSM